MSEHKQTSVEGATNGTRWLAMVLIFLLGVLLGGFVATMLAYRGIIGFQNEVSRLGKEEVKLECPETSVEIKGTQTELTRHEAAGESAAKEFVLSAEQRQRLLSFDVLNLLHDAEIHRYKFEGETRGIQLNKIRSGSLFEKAGFKNGDVIEKVNGLALADLGSNLSTLREDLPKASLLTINVRRDEKLVQIKIRIAGN